MKKRRVSNIMSPRQTNILNFFGSNRIEIRESSQPESNSQFESSSQPELSSSTRVSESKTKNELKRKQETADMENLEDQSIRLKPKNIKKVSSLNIVLAIIPLIIVVLLFALFYTNFGKVCFSHVCLIILTFLIVLIRTMM